MIIPIPRCCFTSQVYTGAPLFPLPWFQVPPPPHLLSLLSHQRPFLLQVLKSWNQPGTSLHSSQSLVSPLFCYIAVISDSCDQGQTSGYAQPGHPRIYSMSRLKEQKRQGGCLEPSRDDQRSLWTSAVILYGFVMGQITMWMCQNVISGPIILPS